MKTKFRYKPDGFHLNHRKKGKAEDFTVLIMRTANV